MAQGMATATLDELISLPLKWGERKTHCVFLPAVFGFFPGASIHWRKNLNLPRAAFSSSQILEPLAPMRLVSLIVGFDTSHYKGSCFFLFFCTFCCLLHWMLSNNMEPCEEYMCKTWIELWVVEIELDGKKYWILWFLLCGLGRCVDQRNLQECCWGCGQCRLHNSSTWWFNSARPLSSGKTNIPPLLVTLCCKS